MPILYSVVSCKNHILWKFASCDGNFNEIAEQILSKLPEADNKMTYSHGMYLLHYIAKDTYFYLCITDRSCQRSRAFLFLNEIQRIFLARRRNDDFTKELAEEMYRYSEDYSTITIRKGELDQINSIRVGSSESILGEKILYVKNPDNISYSTVSYITKAPDQITVSTSHRFYLIILAVILTIVLTVYLLGPVSCALIIAIGLYSILRINSKRANNIVE